MQKPLYSKIASALQAYNNCIKSDALHPREAIWLARLTNLKDILPAGSGFNSGSYLDIDASTPDKLVFVTSFHYMNDSGYYDSRSDHTVIVTPSLIFGFNTRISGVNQKGIKEYIHERFCEVLSQDFDWNIAEEKEI
jgi:hypothetical protein